MQGSFLNKIIGPSFLVCLLFWVCSENSPLDPNANSNQQFIVLVGLQSNPATVPPGGNAIITALVIDQDNRPAPGTVIQFSTNTGSVAPLTSATNDSGVATTIFTAPQQSTQAVVTGRINAANMQTVNIRIQNTTPQSISIAPAESAILANGISTTKITSVWRTEDGQPLKGLPITFETTAGTIINAIASTDSFGVAAIELTSTASRTDAIAQVTATGSDLQATTQVLLKGINFQLTASPTSLFADGRSISNIKAVLKETTSSVAISGAGVTFGATLGTIPNIAFTSSSGVIDAYLTSSADTGVTTVTATYGDALTETVQVVFGQSVPTHLNVTAQPTEILADNLSTATITAVVSDQANNPISDGTPVTFRIIDGTGTIESNKVTQDGVASSKLTSSTQPDTVSIAVQVGQLADTATVCYVTGQAAVLTLRADSSSIRADGIAKTRLVANVSDQSGNPVDDGTKVDFSSTLGEISPQSVQTVSGVAIANLSSIVTGVAVVNASTDGVSDEVTVHLRPGPPNSITLDYTPQFIAVKYSAEPSTSIITAVVLDSEGNSVIDGTYVLFSIYSSPGGGEFLSSDKPVPTSNGRSHVAFNSGIYSGTARIKAEITDENGIPILYKGKIVSAVSTEILIHGGPPYMEDVNNDSTSHLTITIESEGWNVYGEEGTLNPVGVTAVVHDKYHNPVPPGTVVHFTTSGGLITTQTVTNELGLAAVTLITSKPQPTIARYYEILDPNYGYHADYDYARHPLPQIPGPIPDYELSEIINSKGDLGENDGVARILAWTEGVDRDSISTRVWDVAEVVFSEQIAVFEITPGDTVLSINEDTIIDFKIYDINGNAIVPSAEIIISSDYGSVRPERIISNGRRTHFQAILINDVEPDELPKTTVVTIEIVNASLGQSAVKYSRKIQLTF